jgi:lactate dehydrogenase-like 2-hydroxyacid dehydrogenase
VKPEIIITARGHAGTMATLQSEFDAHLLSDAADRNAFLRQHAGVRGLATFGPMPVEAKLMDALPKLEIISNFGVGVDAINLDDAKKRRIIVTNTPDVLNEAVADTAIALVLNTVRKFPQSELYLRGGSWASRGPYPLTTDIGGKTLGVLGLGRIGEAIARRAQACGMKIRYHNRNRKDVPYDYDPDAVTLARNCDVLVVVTPATAETSRIISAKVLDALGPQGYLVNIARGTATTDPRAMVTR